MAEVNSLQNPIQSRQNKVVKQVCALLEKKERRSAELFRFDGIKLLCEAAEKGLSIENVIISSGVRPAYLQRALELDKSGALGDARICYVSEEVFLKMSEESSPEGIITVAKFPCGIRGEIGNIEEYSLDSSERILLAESLRDPGNLGTVIRSAAALGIDRLIISDDCADLYNPKTVRATMSAIFSVPIITDVSTEDAIAHLKKHGFETYGGALTDNSSSLYETNFSSRCAIIIGNEANGITDKTLNLCDHCIRIPMEADAESLNAAVAAAVMIYEQKRQKINRK